MTQSLKSFRTLYEMMAAFPDEQSAIDHFTAIRWAGGAFCPYCGSKKVYHFSDKRTHKCGGCRKRFSIKVGSIFEDSKIELRKWLITIWLITSHKKGIASTQLAKDIGVSQKTAWYMLHRLRHAAKVEPFQPKLSGDVEIDETMIGGTATGKGSGFRGNKSMVLGMLQRDGKLIAGVITDMTKPAMHKIIKDNVEIGSILHTDRFGGYKDIEHEGYRHVTVNHRAGQHATKSGGGVNAIEGYWSQLKRQIVGIHHWVSPKHLNRYVAESSWRFNRRDFEEVDRVNALIADSAGRLRYKELIA